MMSFESSVFQGGEPAVSTEKHEQLAYNNMTDNKSPP